MRGGGEGNLELNEFEVLVLAALARRRRSMSWNRLAKRIELGVGYSTFIDLDDRTDRLRRHRLIARRGLGRSARYKITGQGRAALAAEL